MNEWTTIQLPEVTQEEYLKQIKDYLVEAEKKQRSLENEISHYRGIVNRTKDIHL